jgi:hypothetical protein
LPFPGKIPTSESCHVPGKKYFLTSGTDHGPREGEQGHDAGGAAAANFLPHFVDGLLKRKKWFSFIVGNFYHLSAKNADFLEKQHHDLV